MILIGENAKFLLVNMSLNLLLGVFFIFFSEEIIVFTERVPPPLLLFTAKIVQITFYLMDYLIGLILFFTNNFVMQSIIKYK